MFLGHAKNNYPEGWGVLKSDNSIQCGTFEKGLLTDTLCYIYYPDGQLRYQGGVKEGAYQDYGTLLSEKGDTVYAGTWEKGAFNGNGRVYKYGRLYYTGELKNGKANGKGTSYSADGSVIYTGGWKNGLYEGDGTLYVHGIPQNGSWTEGKHKTTFKEKFFNEYQQIKEDFSQKIKRIIP